MNLCCGREGGADGGMEGLRKKKGEEVLEGWNGKIRWDR